MFDDMTYENILSRCLERVATDVDKREGSVIYDAIAPVVAELAILYIELGTLMDRAFIDTATGIDLTNKTRERSIVRLNATSATRKGTFKDSNGDNMDVNLDTRYSGGDVNYIATEKISTGVYKLVSETAGTIGNTYFGTLIPIDYVEGLATATLSDVLIPGEDEETNEELRIRYYKSLESEAFGGNIVDYISKTEKIAGVGQVKVFPAWDGGGTVKVVIVDSSGGVPSQTLIDRVQEELDPIQNSGEGYGIAPIGHEVTVVGVTGTTVNIDFSLTMQTGVTYEDIKDNVEEVIQNYFNTLIADWADNDYLTVRISQLEATILNVNGVVDITGTELNSSESNLVLTNVAIPLMGTVTNT